MEKLVNILEEFLPVFLAWGGTIISVLAGALFSHKFLEQRERDKWLIQNLISSLRKSVLLIKKIDKLHRHSLLRDIDKSSGQVTKLPGELGEPNMASEEPGERIEHTMNPNSPENDSKIAAEFSAEIETEVFFLIASCNQFKHTKTSAEKLKKIIEESQKFNKIIIETKYRKQILEELNKILGSLFCNYLKMYNVNWKIWKKLPK